MESSPSGSSIETQMPSRGTTLLHRIKKCPVHLVVRITAPPAFCYLPYFIRLSQKELQDQFKESFCCLAPSGSSLDRNNPFTSSLQRLSKVLNFCIIVSFALSFVKPKVGKKTACRQSEYKTPKTAPGKLPKAVFVQIVLRQNGRCRLRDSPQPVHVPRHILFYRIGNFVSIR